LEQREIYNILEEGWREEMIISFPQKLKRRKERCYIKPLGII
jgi:hypothetical protein